MTGQVANSGSGSISVTGGSFATAELEDFIDPDRTIILTLELGEGAAGAAAMAATSGAAVGTLPTPERSGYAFAGWYTAADGGTAVTADTVFDANTTLYARWTEKSEDGEHLITVDQVTGGSLEVSAGRADEGETVTITAAPDDGYELKKLTVTDSQDGAVRVLLRCGPVGCGAGDRLRCHRNGLRPGPRMHTGPACDLPVAGKRLS